MGTDNERIFFSIVMPNYNKSDYITDSIKSVLEQSYPYYELIIIDDGSTDDSIKKIMAFEDKRIRVFHDENRGASVARNKGIKLANYEYIAFLDSDDLWSSNYLEKTVELINQFPQCGAYGCSFIKMKYSSYNMDVFNSLPCETQNIVIQNYFEWVLSGRQGLTASSAVVKKDSISKVGAFPQGVSNWEDLDFWARIGLYYDIGFSTSICVIYNEITDSASKNLSNLQAPIIENYKSYMNDLSIPASRKKFFLEYIYYLKMESTWQQYLIDRDGVAAIKKIKGCFNTKLNRKRWISGMIQYLFTPELYNRIRGNSE